MFKKSSMRQIRNNFVFFITRPRGAGEVENLKIPHLAVCSHKLQGIMRKIPTTIKQDSRRIHQAMFPLSIVPPRMKVSELMLKPCKARVLLDFGWFHHDSNCFWVCYSKAHLGSNRSSRSHKSTPCKPKPASNKGEQNDCKHSGKMTALCFPGGFRVPQVLPRRRLGTDSMTSGSCTRSCKQFSSQKIQSTAIAQKMLEET